MTLREHLNPLYARRVAITTALTTGECVERLRADIAPWYVFWGVTRTLKGRAGEEGFALTRYTGARKSLPSQARGRFAPDGRGTLLEFAIGWRRADLAGLTLALVFLAAVAWSAGREDPALRWLPWVFVPAVALASTIHRLATFHDDEWLVARLCEILQGTEVPRRD